MFTQEYARPWGFLLLIGILLVASLPQHSVLAADGTCATSNYTHRGAYKSAYNYGVGATIEWDQPGTPCAYPNAFSVAWPMASGDDTYIQGGWFKRNGYNTEFFFEWQRPGELYSRRIFGYNGTSDLRFVVERNEALGSKTWSLIVVRPSDGTRTTAYSVDNIPTPMSKVLVYAETNYTGQRMWGSPADNALFSNFRYDAGSSSGGWQDINLICQGEPDPNHYQLSCGAGTAVSSFTTWDDRR